MRGTSEEPSREAARAVRRLLEEAVPSPPAPADRMARVALRVRRYRRRRRAVAGAVVSAAAVVAAVTVAPGRSAHPAVPAGPAAFPTGGPVARLLDPSRPVRVQVPKGWHSLSVRDEHGDYVGFVSSQPLRAPVPEGCYGVPGAALHGCLPLPRGLEAGGALLVLRYGSGGHVADGAPWNERSVGPPMKNCAGTGADRESVAWGVAHTARVASLEVQVSVCLKEPSGAAAALVEKILDTAFPATGK